MRDNSFFQAICRVGIFMICAQAMVHFRPQEAYEKYLKLLVGVMVLIQLFLPIGSFLLRGGGQEAARLLEQFQADLERDMREAAERAGEADALLEQMTLEEVMRQLEGTQEETAGSGESGDVQESQGGTGSPEVPGGRESQGGTGSPKVPGGRESQGGTGSPEVPGGRESQGMSGKPEVLGGEESQGVSGSRAEPEETEHRAERKKQGMTGGDRDADDGRNTGAGEVRVDVKTIEPIIIRTDAE